MNFPLCFLHRKPTKTCFLETSLHGNKIETLEELLEKIHREFTLLLASQITTSKYPP